MKKLIRSFLSVLLISAFLFCLASCLDERKEAESQAAEQESSAVGTGTASVETGTAVTGSEKETETENTEATETESIAQTGTETAESESSALPDEPEPPEELFVSYADFGAIGDGETDDFNALYAVHGYANEKALPVKATEGAVYYIGESSVGRHIDIKTDTDWTGAKFIIDDRYVKVDENNDYKQPVFRIAPSVEGRSVKSVTSAKKGAERLGFSPGEKCLAVIENKYSKVFIRTGVHAGGGETNKEILLLDENGNIDGSTPLNFDYNSVTALTLYHIDDTVLTVRGGEFHTITKKNKPYLK